MSAEIVVALIAAPASILGAAITFFLTKSKERSDQLQQRKQIQTTDQLAETITNDRQNNLLIPPQRSIILVRPKHK